MEHPLRTHSIALEADFGVVAIELDLLLERAILHSKWTEVSVFDCFCSAG